MENYKPTFIIAEIGQAHDGSLGIAHSYIDALADSGVDAVKFQTHIAESESSPFEDFRINFSYEDKSRFDYWKRIEFSEDQWLGLKKHCDEKKLEFISSPFSIAAVDLLEKINVKRYKIGSGEIDNLLMLEKICKTQKPIILSTGLTDYDQLQKTMDFISRYDNEISILQCTSEYPTNPKNIGLNIISELKEKYPNVKIGLSDHSGEIYSSLAAVVLGSDIIEFHAVFDKKMFGPDSVSSLEFRQINELVKGVRFLEVAIKNPVNKSIKFNLNMSELFGKSLSVNKIKHKGQKIVLCDLESKKPRGKGIPASDFEQIIGKELLTDLEKNAFLNYNILK
jgi:N-acetylneuraminate synthase